MLTLLSKSQNTLRESKDRGQWASRPLFFLKLTLSPHLGLQMWHRWNLHTEEKFRNHFLCCTNHPLAIKVLMSSISPTWRERIRGGLSGMTGTYTLMRYSQSWQFLEKQVSISFSVPVSASCPQPQNSATPKKHNPVATREANGAPTRHLAQHSNKPRKKEQETVMDVQQEARATQTSLPDQSGPVLTCMDKVSPPNTKVGEFRTLGF